MSDERSPMKAPTKSCDPTKLNYPVLDSDKLDGVRGFVRGGVLLSNSLKPIPNRTAQLRYGRLAFEGLDGELVCGPPNAVDCCRRTVSCVMSEHSEDEANLALYVFDSINDQRPYGFRDRLDKVRAVVDHYGGKSCPLVAVEHRWAMNVGDLLIHEATALAKGFEGLMVRAPLGAYKYGPNRCTIREGYLFKLKRFVDAEARVVELVEGTINTNEAKRSETGRSKRPTNKAGKVPSGMVGTIKAIDIKTGQLIDVGPGRMTHQERRELLADPKSAIGELLTYKYFPSGAKDAPRFAAFKCWRDERDMSPRSK